MIENKWVKKGCVIVASVLLAFLFKHYEKEEDVKESDVLQELVEEAKEKYPSEHEMVAVTKLAEQKSENYFESTLL